MTRVDVDSIRTPDLARIQRIQPSTMEMYVKCANLLTIGRSTEPTAGASAGSSADSCSTRETTAGLCSDSAKRTKTGLVSTRMTEVTMASTSTPNSAEASTGRATNLDCGTNESKFTFAKASRGATTLVVYHKKNNYPFTVMAATTPTTTCELTDHEVPRCYHFARRGHRQTWARGQSEEDRPEKRGRTQRGTFPFG